MVASLIDGKTTHTIGMISHNNMAMSAETKAKLQVFWKLIKYLIIDEISMIGKAFLAKLSRNIGIGKMIEGKPPSPHSFGGLSLVISLNFLLSSVEKRKHFISLLWLLKRPNSLKSWRLS